MARRCITIFTVCGCQLPPRGVLTFRLVSHPWRYIASHSFAFEQVPHGIRPCTRMLSVYVPASLGSSLCRESVVSHDGSAPTNVIPHGSPKVLGLAAKHRLVDSQFP